MVLGVIAGMLLLSGPAFSQEIQVSRFKDEGLQGWDVQSFKGRTEYSLTSEDGHAAVKAQSRNAASGLIKKLSLDPHRFRYLRWYWKIGGTIAKGDETSKAGDDYAARVYVIFPGRFFWQTRAINYIWANHLAKGSHIANAYSSRAVMFAVETGNDKAGQWCFEQRDILADYRTAFGTDPDRIGAIAIMTDTDNTGSEAQAWYRDVVLATDRQ